MSDSCNINALTRPATVGLQLSAEADFKKITLIGNCQGTSAELCLQVMIPDAETRAIMFDAVIELPESGVIFLQHSNADMIKPDTPAETVQRIRFFPNFYYPGFHPDLIYIRGPHAQSVPSPIGDYHSSLVLYGWLRGLSVKEVISLFCEPVFDRLGWFEWINISDQWLLESGRLSGIDLSDQLARWKKQGCFSHSTNHPKLYVVCDIFRAILEQAGISIRVSSPANLLNDPMLVGPIWPVYPEIASAIGIQGDYTFKVPFSMSRKGRAIEILDLEAFVEESFKSYNAAPRDIITPDRDLSRDSSYNNLEALVARSKPKASDRLDANPYSKLPSTSFWRKAIAIEQPGDLDLIRKPKFVHSTSDRIATAGSCFAQHIARTLIQENYNYLQTELPPAGMTAEEAASSGYGLFSARYGNVYTARQLLQLLRRAYGEFSPSDSAWRSIDGMYVDPFRPQIKQNGFNSIEELDADRERHLVSVRRVFEESDLFIFTVGLTEAWVNNLDGAVYPVAPGVITGNTIDQARSHFVNFTTSETFCDLKEFIEQVKIINPNLNILLTVSPVPLIATYDDRNVIVSTYYSKASLRAAVGELADIFDFVDYFPSFETIMFHKDIYFEEDKRNVKPEGVAHAMRLFMKHYTVRDEPKQDQGVAVLIREMERRSKILCDEELLDRKKDA